jgi:drug/metabolite transporter (DMT)-like permease
MNPLSFVTVFTVGELGMMLVLSVGLGGGFRSLYTQLRSAHAAIFWLFLGGFCWVIGDLFQQYSTKYVGIGRAIPLSNTNQLWGLAWGVLVFGGLAATGVLHHVVIVAGSVVMLLGTLGISTSVASSEEHSATRQAILRECDRYSLDYLHALNAQSGQDSAHNSTTGRRWWDYVIAILAIGVFVALAVKANRPALPMHMWWANGLLLLLLLTFLGAGWWLWKKTRFC